ncbi:broad specificity phosphatase PhoE [Nakamurella sp. UYEF19]|uniref:histidine phosphatase family protein n=1 Tax=Nakamurella sp. UYEF19 TaxID=1756392 RepID=UPI00339119AD
MRLILLRHGESIGNVDESAFCRVPDHTMELTDVGREQSREAGLRLREVIGPAPIDVFVSPYRRTWQTLELLGLQDRVRRVREEPRLREQDWGNLQTLADQVRQRRERDAFGHFFYRLASGESGADVYDRLTGFLTGLTSPWADRADEPGRTVLLITHGLAMRLACMALMGWTVAEFEALSNPSNGDFRVLTRLGNGSPTGGGLLGLGPGWELDRPFATWR